MPHSPAYKLIVLHIDDDEDDRSLIEEGIYELDPRLEVVQASNGKDGLSALKQLKASGTLPCLIIVDLNMPGMDGKAVLDEIRADADVVEVPVVLLTTSTASTDKEFAERKRVALLEKPTGINQLKKTVDTLLRHCYQDR